jgi:hypothetical protein
MRKNRTGHQDRPKRAADKGEKERGKGVGASQGWVVQLAISVGRLHQRVEKLEWERIRGNAKRKKERGSRVTGNKREHRAEHARCGRH